VTDKEHILFAGDVSYNHQQVLDNKFAGSNIDYAASQKTYNTILKYAEKYPLIYLTSHDQDSANRLVGVKPTMSETILQRRTDKTEVSLLV